MAREPIWPTHICLAGVKVKAVTAGATHSMALTEAGDVFSWGQSDFGALGHGPGEFITAASSHFDEE